MKISKSCLVKKIVLLIFSATTVLKCFSQELTQIQTQRIAAFGKVWGIMKYYHPTLAAGNLNWNDSLRNYIPKIKDCGSDKVFNSLLNNLFNNAGQYSVGEKFSRSEKYFTQTFETGWISESGLIDSAMKKRLQGLLIFFHPKKNFLVLKESGIHDATIIHNNERDNIATLIIAWNIIKYEAPHLKLAEDNWDDLLEQHIPVVSAIKDPAKFEYALAEMVSKIRDSHGFVTLPNYEASLGTAYLPFSMDLIENKNVIRKIDTIAAKNYNIDLGDIVEKINDVDVSLLRDSFRNISRGGHLKVRDAEVDEFYLTRIKGKDPARITLRKPGNILMTIYVQPMMNRSLYDPVTAKAKNKSRAINDSVSYISLRYSSAKDIKTALGKFHHFKSIIIDNRGYPSGKTYSALFNRLDGGNDRIINYYKQNNETFTGSFPGKYLNSPYYRLRGFANLLKPFYKKYKGRIIVLFDETTLSHAEFRNQGFSFIKNDVVTIGRNSAGADGAIYFRYLPGKIRIAFTGDIVTYPDGTSTQKTGMKPDFYTDDSIESVRKGKDDILEKAIEIATKRK
jgi:C-terminal processing protease CtpA/Prc